MVFKIQRDFQFADYKYGHKKLLPWRPEENKNIWKPPERILKTVEQIWILQ